jgi:hypothetical protein
MNIRALSAALAASAMLASCVLSFDTTLPGESAPGGSTDDTGGGGDRDVARNGDVGVHPDDVSDVEVEVCTIDSPAGRFLLSLIISPLDRQQLSPLMVDLTIVPEGNGQFSFNFQPIATDFILVDQQRQPRVSRGSPGEEGYSPAPREAVGNPIIVNDIVIDGAGAFTVSVVDIRIDGFANPLTFRDILADLTLVGSLRSNDIGCGDVSGAGKEPIPNLDLNTSVFGMIRVDDPQTYTYPILISCAAPQAANVDPCD